MDDFDDLAAALRQIVIEMCGGGSVAITKLVDEKGDGTNVKPDPGWTFTADVTMRTGSYTWVEPGSRALPVAGHD